MSISGSTMRARFRPKPDGRKDPAGEAGWYLERERLAQGISLEKASQDLGIHPHHLEAIEMGDLSGLPPRREALEMIGAYAAYLGFDAQPLMRHYAQLMPKETGAKWFSSARIIRFPLIERLRGMPQGAGDIVTSVLAAVLLFGGVVWALLPEEEPGEGWTEITAEAAPQTGNGETEQVADTGSGKVQADPRSVATIGALAQKAASEEAVQDAGQAAPSGLDDIGRLIMQTVPEATATTDTPKTGVSATTAAPAAGHATPAQHAATDKDVPWAAAGPVYRLRAVRDIWLQVEDAEGRTLFSGDLKAGSSFTLPAGIAPESVIITSNDGGALEIIAGGKVLHPGMADGEAIVGRSLSDLVKKARG